MTRIKIIDWWLVCWMIIGITSALAMTQPSLPGKGPAKKMATDRWKIDTDHGIFWDISKDENLPHKDNIEMSGGKVSLILNYGIDSTGALELSRHIVWPMLRTIPNNTHASLSHDFGIDIFPTIIVNSKPLRHIYPTLIKHHGIMGIHAKTDTSVQMDWTIFPSTHQPAIIENITLHNTTDHLVNLTIEPFTHTFRTDSTKGVDGVYVLECILTGTHSASLHPGESTQFSLIFSGRKESEKPLTLSPMEEEIKREQLVQTLWNNLVFECPDKVISHEFAFAKIRTSESIYKTKGGLLHSPGGGAYYAAIWANDQAEYANPFFPYLGYEIGNESALNAFRHFARYMKPDYAPVPSSIIAEGLGIWNGAGDRGDAAMIAYGASRYALSLGDKKVAEELWSSIEWCLEYCHRKTTSQGIIASDKDELEGRFPAGKANLCTSSLNYDALISAAYLGKSLGKPKEIIEEYRNRAESLKQAIETCFGATMEGFNTYRYYEENTTLRAWICIPLTMGIMERKEGTIDALFSPQLWTENGLATEAGKKTFWDRATLYGFRGVFAAGDTERALSYLHDYSRKRLLGEHVPYPVEAWPEGNQRHLSAESALYCRIITEGIFGIRPTGLQSFTCQPQLPQKWESMSLQNIHAFGNTFDMKVTRKNHRLLLVVNSGANLILKTPFNPGDIIPVQLPE